MLPPLVNDAGSTLVVTGMILLLVAVECTVLPAALVLVIVMTNCETELDVIWVRDASVLVVNVDVTGTVVLLPSVELTDSEVRVDVTTTTGGEEEVTGGRVTTEEVETTVGEVTSLVVTVVDVDGSSLLVGVADEAEVESVLESGETPVVKATF